jgi:putative redox protein
MKGKVNWVGDNTYLGESGSGHAIVMQAGGPAGGPTIGASPMELVLLGAGGCTSVDVVLILKRGRHDVRGCTVELDAERAPSEPKVFTRIHYHFIATGRGLTQDVVARAIELSAQKYCSATIMLGKTATISHDFEIREAD